MRVLTFTNLYPSAAQPRHGIFVEHRVRQLVRERARRMRVCRAGSVGAARAAVRSLRHASSHAPPRSDSATASPCSARASSRSPELTSWINPLLMALECVADGAQAAARSRTSTSSTRTSSIPTARLQCCWVGGSASPSSSRRAGTDINTFPHYAVPRRWIRWVARHADALVTRFRSAAPDVARSRASSPSAIARVAQRRRSRSCSSPGDREAARAELGFDGPLAAERRPPGP